MAVAKGKKDVEKTASPEDVLALVEAAQALEEENSQHLDSGGDRIPFIKCLSKAEMEELDKDSKNYVKGAKFKDFVVPASKTLLGNPFDFTVLAVFKMYEDKEQSEVKGALPKIRGYWMPEEAQQIDTIKDSNFIRAYIDKQGKLHRVDPVFWVYGLLNDHIELGMHMFILRSTANENVRKLQKSLQNLSGITPQHIFSVEAEKREFPKFKSATYRPLFEETGKVNFEIDKKGVIKPGKMSKEDSLKVIETYTALQKSYASSNLVSKRKIKDVFAALPAPEEEINF
jgi:hypothetical protein